MARIEESVVVRASLADTWELYFDRRGWPAWVDGFAAVIEDSGGYPSTGGTLRWRSTPAGRGEVHERVLEHEPRRLHRVEWSDPSSSGESGTTFAIEPGAASPATRVTQALEYRLRSRGPFAWITERLFVRSQVRGSVRRSLLRFKHEAEEALRLAESE